MRADKFAIVLRVHYFCRESKKTQDYENETVCLCRAAAGGVRKRPSAQKAAETRTEVKHGPEIVLSAPDTVGGATVGQALAAVVRGASTAPSR